MAKNCIGLDLGSSAVKVTQVKRVRGGGFQLLQFGLEPLPADTIVDGAILNHAVVADAIRAVWKRLKLSQKEVAIAISGNAIIIKKIYVAAMSPAELEQQVPWEAEHHIPFSKSDVELDYQVLDGKNAAGQQEVLLVAAKKEIVADYASVARQAGLNPVVIDVAAFAIQNGFEAAYGPQEETVALINVGAAQSTLNIVARGSSVFTRDVATGGNTFTDELKRHMAISTDEAESLKIAFANGDGQPDVGRVLSQSSNAMASEFQKSIDFFLATQPDLNLSRIYLSGGSARIPSLLGALENRIRVPVELMEPFRNMAPAPSLDPAFLEMCGAQAVVSLGLAMRSPGDKFE
jgi:type IV pilus assembly protein PilM